MKKFIPEVSALALAVAASNVSALQALNDDHMAQVTGQAGITIEQDTESFSASEISYTDDGVSLQFIQPEYTAANGASTFHTLSTIDVNEDGDFIYEVTGDERTFNMAGISLSGDDDNFFGLEGTYSDHLKLVIGSDDEGNIDLSGTEYETEFSRLFFKDGDYDWILTDFGLSVLINYGRLINTDQGVKLDLGDETNRGLHFDYSVGGVGLGLGNDPFAADGSLNKAFGSLDISLDAYGSITLRGGGATGSEGITFIPGLTLINDDNADADASNDTPAFKYTDDGFIILAEDFSGTFSSENGFTLDLESDDEGSLLALRYQDFDLAFSLDNFILGGTEEDYLNGLSRTMGSFRGEIHFRDGIADGEYRENYMKFRAGGLDGDGITADISWNIVSDDPVMETDDIGSYNRPGDLNTYIAMNDDGNWVYFNGFNSYGSGRAYVDITKQSDNPGTNGLYSNDYDGYFDGLRITFQNVKGSYSFSGVTVGRDIKDAEGNVIGNEAEEAPLMGGTELLLALEVFPSYDFTLNGAITLTPGDVNATDPNDRQGITLNGDLYISDANAAVTVDEYGRGVWLTETNYDIHMRDASLTVTEDGLTFNKGLTWSRIEVGDVRFGSKYADDSKSLGSFTLERLEDGTTLSVASGGAGQVCIDGSLNGGGTGCADSNGDGIIDSEDGVFIDRGEQGLNIKVKAIFAEDDGTDARYAGKGNRFSWTQPNGTTIALENFSTSDGPGSGTNGSQTNEYGLNIDIAVDVAPTIVRDQAGNLVQDDALGFAVYGRLHFKQLNIDGLSLAATPESTPQTLIQGIVVQNADIQANLTATPIR